MFQVNITPKGRTILRFGMDTPRTETTVGRRLSDREYRREARLRAQGRPEAGCPNHLRYPSQAEILKARMESRDSVTLARQVVR